MDSEPEGCPICGAQPFKSPAGRWEIEHDASKHWVGVRNNPKLRQSKPPAQIRDPLEDGEY